MLNRVQLIGNVGRDVELRHTPGGMAVTQVSLATNRRWRNRATGEIEQQTDWHQVTIWGNQAINAATILRKGRLVFVEGRLRTRSWDDQDTGKRQYRTEIVCDRFQALGSRPEADRPEETVETEAELEVAEAAHEVTEPDDDIPF
jgi:single-strand DNA-binding protein